MAGATQARRRTVHRSPGGPVAVSSRDLRGSRIHCQFVYMTRKPAPLQRASPARRPGRVGIYACGPTVYSRIHVGNARPFVVFSLLKRFLEHEGYDVTFVANVTDVNDKIYDARARRGASPARELAREMTARLRRGHRRARPRAGPTTSRWPSETIDGDRRPIEAPDRPRRTPTRPAATSTSACARDPRTARCRTATSTRWTRARGSRAPIARRTRSTSRCGRRRRRARTPPGTRRGAAAGPAGTSSARRWPRSCSGVDFEVHGGGSDLVFPHHENEAAQTAAARGAPLARIWMHNGMLQWATEKMAKSVGNISLLHEALDECGPRRADHVLPQRPLPPADGFADDALARGGGARERIREAARRLVRWPLAGRHGRLRERFFDGAAPTTSTPPRRWRRCSSWIREANRARGRGARRPGRDARGPRRSSDLLEPARRRGRRGGRGAAARAREEARAARDFAEADRLRDELRARGLGGPRRRRRARARPPCAVIVYGRNPVREALRGRAPPVAARRGRRRRRARGSWLAGRPGRDGRRGERARGRARAARDAHQGIVRRGRALPVRRRGGAARAPTTRCSSRSTRSRTRRTSGAICRTRRVRRRDRRRDPRAPRRPRSRRRCARPRRARSSTCRSPGCATSPTSSARPRRPGCWVLRRGADGRVPTTQPDYAGGSCSCWGPRARACGPRVAEACDELVSLPMRGAGSSRST